MHLGEYKKVLFCILEKMYLLCSLNRNDHLAILKK